MTKSIHHTFTFNHKPEVGWDYLTKPELLAQWLMPADIKPVVGYKFEMVSAPKPQMNHDGHNYCEVLEVVPYKKLVYSWQAGPKPGSITVNTKVTWTLIAKGSGTELHLLHEGFTDENQMLYEGMNGGWVTHVGKIEKLISQ
jgi:uncharacterized protein YndB with AHSA1/START domain